jgi:hypothetical protein
MSYFKKINCNFCVNGEVDSKKCEMCNGSGEVTLLFSGNFIDRNNRSLNKLSEHLKNCFPNLLFSYSIS